MFTLPKIPKQVSVNFPSAHSNLNKNVNSWPIVKNDTPEEVGKKLHILDW